LEFRRETMELKDQLKEAERTVESQSD